MNKVVRNRIRGVLILPFEWIGILLGFMLIMPLPHRALIGLCDALSRMMLVFDRRGRRRALENLRIIRGTCTGDEGTKKFNPDRAPFDPTPVELMILRRSYRNMARTVGHIFWTMIRAKSRVVRVGEVDGRVRGFLAAHRPAVTVSAHLGCWEILSQLAFLSGHRMMSVAKDIGTGGMTKLLMRARKSIGQEIIPADGAFRPLMAGLKAGKSLGLLVDQKVRPSNGGIWVNFLGRPMPVSAAPAFFAAKARVPVLVAWSRPLRDGRYRCEYCTEYPPEAARDIWALTQRIAYDLTRLIRRHPSCWILNYNYFRATPTAEELAQLNGRLDALADR